MLFQLFIIAIGAIVAGFVQGVSGFAFGMVAMSVWIWFLDPVLAATLTIFGSLIGQVIAFFKVKRVIDFKNLWPYLLGGVVGIPIGGWLIPQLNPQYFKLGLGMFLMLWCPVMLCINYLSVRPVKNSFLDIIVGCIGGIMSGLGGFSGIAPTLWTSLTSLDKQAQRNIIQNFNLVILTVTFSYYVSAGRVHSTILPELIVLVLAMLLPTLAGIKYYQQLSEQNFRRWIVVLLGISGLFMTLSSMNTLF